MYVIVEYRGLAIFAKKKKRLTEKIFNSHKYGTRGVSRRPNTPLVASLPRIINIVTYFQRTVPLFSHALHHGCK